MIPPRNRLGKSDYQPLPVLVPLALRAKLCVPLDLESEIACPFSESASYIILHVDVYYSHENKHVYLHYHRKTFFNKKSPPQFPICA